MGAAGLVQQRRGYGPGGAFAAAVAGPQLDQPIPRADAAVGVSDRLRFIRLTCAHLLGAHAAARPCYEPAGE